MEQVQDQQFDQHMRIFMEHRVSPSLAMTAVRGNDMVVARGYGWSNLEQGTNASAETVYLYCSMTKLFIATALMQLGGVLGVALPGAVFGLAAPTAGQFLDRLRLAIFVGAGALTLGAVLALLLPGLQLPN
jgi:hypothetical protein